MAVPALPPPVARLAAELASLPGAVAVVLGGSRAVCAERSASDWDIGLYYRGSRRAIDPADVRRLGHRGVVSAIGEWGPIVNGGAWLTVGGLPVDVLFRDLDAVEAWMADAETGRFEVLAQAGYVAGAPTYLPVGELAVCRPIAGDVPRPRFPPALTETAPARWKGRAAVALMFAHGHAGAGDVAPCVGMLAVATLSAAHARLAQRREWALNEKRLVERAGLGGAAELLAGAGAARPLPETVAALGDALRIAPASPR